MCYDVFFFDDMDWHYRGIDKESIKREIVKILPEAELKGELYGLLIYHVYKYHPSNFLGKVICDQIKYRADNDLENIHDVT